MRIAPVFILATMAGAIMLPISAAINPQFTLVLNGMTFAEPICLLARITTVAAMTSYFDPCAYAGNAPLGTVVAEIDLYIAYALFFWIFVWRGRGYLMFSVIIATFGISLVVISLASYNYQRWFQQNSFISFLPYWWIGALVVNQEVADRLRRIAPILVLFWLGFAAVVAFSAAAPVAGELKKLCYALLIAALIVKMDTIAISDNPMSALGRAGYSIYAFHSPVLCLGLIFGLNPILCLALALIIGILSYRLIELPCIQIGRQMSARPLMVR
jgi:peptidoglycan/LPS O-acetylase OafA/YrhL